MGTRTLLGGLALLLGIAAYAAPSGAAEADGAQVYSKRCAMCHGEDGKGKQLGAGLLQSTDLDAVKKVVREGREKMPGFEKRLSAAELDAVSQYVVELAKKSGG